MAGLDPAIHVLLCFRRTKDVDARHKATAVRFDFMDRVHDVDFLCFERFAHVRDTEGGPRHAASE